jgi:hypothetical protein
VPEALIALFQESVRQDIVDSSHPDEVRHIISYSTSRVEMLERLDVMGASAAAAGRAYEEWRAAELRSLRELAEDDVEWATTVSLVTLTSWISSKYSCSDRTSYGKRTAACRPDLCPVARAR